MSEVQLSSADLMVLRQADIPSVDSLGEVPENFARALAWVKDAPLFIDQENLDRFYDAVVRPTYKQGPQTIKVSESLKKDLENKFGGKAGLHVPAWLSFIFSGGVEVSAEAKRSKSEAEMKESTIALEEIKTPQRQLEQLTVFYLLRQPERLLVGKLDSPLRWQAEGRSGEVPRALAFIDLPKKTKIIPMAAEFAQGKFVAFYQQLTAENGARPPTFKREEEKDYWKWFADNFDAGRAVEVIENASNQYGRVEWIDFRVPLNNAVDTMHLHIEASGHYNIGTFAYRLVRRAEGHGLRVVATLKDGPDFNVLALYEK